MEIYYTGGFRVSHVAQAVLTRAGLADFLLRHLLFACLVSLAYNKYFPLMCIWQVIHRLVFRRLPATGVLTENPTLSSKLLMTSSTLW